MSQLDLLGETDDGCPAVTASFLLGRLTAEEIEIAREFWLKTLLKMFVALYRTGQGDPLLELAEFSSAWGGEADELVNRVAPRGLDALYFGTAARKRFISRLSDVVES